MSCFIEKKCETWICDRLYWLEKLAQKQFIQNCRVVKGELQPKISLLHMKVITLIKAKNNVFL